MEIHPQKPRIAKFLSNGTSAASSDGFAILHLTAQDRLRLLISGEQSSNFRRTTTFLATDKYTSLLRDVTREDPLAVRAGA